MEHCKHEEKINIMYELLQEVRGDIKLILKLKYQIMGAIIICSFLTTLLIGYFLK